MVWIFKFSYILFPCLVILACSTNKDFPQNWKEYNVDGFEFSAPIGFQLINDNAPYQQLINGKGDTIIVFQDNGYPTPTSLEWSFRNAFYAYHYNKFFDQVYMDPKVKKIFRDSVKIIEIITEIEKDEMKKGCSNCNAIAKLQFKKKVFDFPYQMDEKKMVEVKKYKFNSDTTNGFKSVIFQDKNNAGIAGKYFGSGENRKGVILLLNSVTDTSLISPILYSIKENPR